jgi:hypothetical protein
MTDQSFTVDELCAAEKVSKRKLYDDWAKGRGPAFFWNGNRRRISAEARAAWRRQREAEAAAKPERVAEAAARARSRSQKREAEA